MKSLNSYEIFDLSIQQPDNPKDNDLEHRGLTDHERQLVADNYELVKSTVTQMVFNEGIRVDYDDALGYGGIGLCKAAMQYDDTKGASFKTYAKLRIRGSIIDGIRSFDRIDRETGEPRAITLLNGHRGISIDMPIGDDGFTLADTLADDTRSREDVYVEYDERVEAITKAHELLNLFKPKERFVVTEWLGGRTLSDIANELSLTESRVCQIKNGAFRKARIPPKTRPKTSLELKREKDDRYIDPSDVKAIFAIGALKSKIHATQTLIATNEQLAQPDVKHIERLRRKLSQLTYSLVQTADIYRLTID